jgi:hypothetical protein
VVKVIIIEKAENWNSGNTLCLSICSTYHEFLIITAVLGRLAINTTSNLPFLPSVNKTWASYNRPCDGLSPRPNPAMFHNRSRLQCA